MGSINLATFIAFDEGALLTNVEHKVVNTTMTVNDPSGHVSVVPIIVVTTRGFLGLKEFRVQRHIDKKAQDLSKMNMIDHAKRSNISELAAFSVAWSNNRTAITTTH